jgi:Ni/Co efflux regulator RcnB
VRDANFALLNHLEIDMNKKAVVCAVMALYLGTGGLTFAQGYGDRNDRGRDGQGERGAKQERRAEGRPQDRSENGGREYREIRGDERGAGPNHEFYRGGRLPDQYRHRQYVVDDWRGHHLSAPPRGYHWVQTGGDYVLIAIASGIIAQLLLGH